MLDLESTLRAQVKKREDDWSLEHFVLHEEPTAIQGDRWLDEGKSYIWRVATLSRWDANKCDWIEVFVGIQRGPRHQPEFLGKLYFSDGEGDDCARTIMRMVGCLSSTFACASFSDLPPFKYEKRESD